MTHDCLAELVEVLPARTACRLVGRSRATYYRRLKPPPAPQPGRARPAPGNKLSDTEAQTVLEVLRSPRFVDVAPAQVWAELLDEGTYLCSQSTMYRLLRSHGEVRERRRQATHRPKTVPHLCAYAPMQVWSWDITKLRGPRRGVFFDLYVINDIYSRYIPGWMVAATETGELAEQFLADATAVHGAPRPRCSGLIPLLWVGVKAAKARPFPPRVT